MSLRERSFVIALIITAAAVAVFGSASASAATWTVEGKGLTEPQAVNSSLKAGTTATLKGKILGQEFVLTATTVTDTGAQIYQEGSKAKMSGVYEFSGLTVDKPAGCTVTSPVATKPLVGELIGGAENKVMKLVPQEGEVFTTIKVNGCAIAGSYNVKGVLYAEDAPWVVFGLVIIFVLRTPILHSYGGGLTLGSSPAELSADIANSLVSGKEFGADE